jgi:hypothetical protein
MKGFLKALILLPIAAVITIFAVAHRDPVTLSWNPLERADPTYQITVPLFAVVFASLALGVIIGGIGTWLAQGGHRKAERQHARTVDQQRRELDELRAMRELPQLPPPSMLR